MNKGSKIYGVTYFRRFQWCFVIYSSSTSEDYHDMNKLCDLRLRHGRCLEVILVNVIEFLIDAKTYYLADKLQYTGLNIYTTLL